jgi:hypothetical protein
MSVGDRLVLVLSFPLIAPCDAVCGAASLLLFSRVHATQMLCASAFSGTLFEREVPFPKLINLVYFGL